MPLYNFLGRFPVRPEIPRIEWLKAEEVNLHGATKIGGRIGFKF
jgi:hypothetical protein